jgi:hypothetical protein
LAFWVIEPLQGLQPNPSAVSLEGGPDCRHLAAVSDACAVPRLANQMRGSNQNESKVDAVSSSWLPPLTEKCGFCFKQLKLSQPRISILIGPSARP